MVRCLEPQMRLPAPVASRPLNAEQDNLPPLVFPHPQRPPQLLLLHKFAQACARVAPLAVVALERLVDAATPLALGTLVDEAEEMFGTGLEEHHLTVVVSLLAVLGTGSVFEELLLLWRFEAEALVAALLLARARRRLSFARLGLGSRLGAGLGHPPSRDHGHEAVADAFGSARLVVLEVLGLLEGARRRLGHLGA